MAIYPCHDNGWWIIKDEKLLFRWRQDELLLIESNARNILPPQIFPILKWPRAMFRWRSSMHINFVRLDCDYQPHCDIPSFPRAPQFFIADISSCFILCTFLNRFFRSLFHPCLRLPFAITFLWIQFLPLLCNVDWRKCLRLFVPRGWFIVLKARNSIAQHENCSLFHRPSPHSSPCPIMPLTWRNQ